jgi:hypothetical protein
MTAIDMTSYAEQMAQAGAQAAFAYQERCRAERRMAWSGFPLDMEAEAAWSEFFPTAPQWWIDAYTQAWEAERKRLERKANTPRERAKRDPAYAAELVMREWDR